MQNTWTDNLILYVEVSSICNALCPQCDRYKPGTLEIHDHVSNTYWSLDKFKRAFTPDNLEHAKVINFAGLYGDPLTNPHLIDMISYVLDNSDCRVDIETNASLKSTKWWANLAKVGGDRIKVQFDVDGTTQEIHSKYRINTNLNKVLSNMKAFADAGGKPTVMTIVFRHNEKELESIRELTKNYGAVEWNATESLRFFAEDDTYTFTDIKGDLIAIQTPVNPIRSKQTLRRIRNFSDERVSPTVCPSSEQNFLQIDQHGNVWPCCDLLEAYDRNWEDVGYTDDINLFKQPLKDILISNWYRSFKPNYKQCDIWCSHKKSSNDLTI